MNILFQKYFMISTEVSFIHHFEMTYNSQKFRLFEYTLFAYTYNQI